MGQAAGQAGQAFAVQAYHSSKVRRFAQVSAFRLARDEKNALDSRAGCFRVDRLQLYSLLGELLQRMRTNRSVGLHMGKHLGTGLELAWPERQSRMKV